MSLEPISASGSDDPLALALQPPPNESLEERQARESGEMAAKLRSESIDEYLKLSRKRDKDTKVLLLGHENSRNAMLNVLRVRYPVDDLAQEHGCSWKSLIQFNLIRHVLIILKVLEGKGTTSCPLSSTAIATPSNVVSYDVSAYPAPQRSSPNPPDTASGDSSNSRTAFNRTVRLRLAPLAEIESRLAKQFTLFSSEEPVVVSYTARTKHLGYRSPSDNASSAGRRFEEEVGLMLNASKEDIATLWSDTAVRALLRERNVKLQSEGEFFLDDSDRVCARDYEPSDLDICNLSRNMGVSETGFRLESYLGDWKVYNIHGSRTLRLAWVPFFDDVDAIIFFVRISAFDQWLVDGSRMCYLEHSMLDWHEICQKELLMNVDLILCFDQIDLLERKLNSGIQVNKYLPQYKGPNTPADVCKYVERKFVAIHNKGLKRLSDGVRNPVENGGKATERRLRVHHTNAIDAATIRDVIHRVQDSVLVRRLKSLPTVL